MAKAKGGRPATGHIDWRRNAKTKIEHWHTRIMLTTGKRSKWIPLDPSIAESDREGAKACALLVSDAARKEGWVPESTKETVSEYAKRWHDWRALRGLSCVKDDRARMTNHVHTVIGPLDVSSGHAPRP